MSKFFLLLHFIFMSAVFADTADFVLSEVKVECEVSEFCQFKKRRFGNLKGAYRSLVHLKETLRIMASDGGYQSFSYDIYKTENAHGLSIRVKIKPTVNEINIGFVDRNIELDPSQLISIKEGDYFETQRLKEDISGLPKRLEALGFPKSTHQLLVNEHGDKVAVNLAITLGQPRVFKSVKSNATSPYVRDYLKKKFFTFYNKPFDMTRFKIFLDDAQKELFSYGYYLINLDFTPVYKKNDRVVLDIKVMNDKLYAFDFKNLKEEHRQVIHDIVRELFRKYKRPLSENTIKLTLEEHYRHRALLNASVNIATSKFENRYKEEVTLYRITLDEQLKSRLKSLNFLGHTFFTKKDLKEMYQKDAFELASLNYYDEEYLNYFAGILKSKYIEHGYVSIKIIGPTKTFNPDKTEATVEYTIQEGQRAFVRTIEFDGLPPELEEPLLQKLNNKTSSPFNPISMGEDLKLVSVTMQEKGYYFAEVTNGNEDTLVRYSRTGADVDIMYQVNPGPLVKLNRVIYLGNNMTRKKVLEKKIQIEKNDFITPSKTRDFEAALSSTGLFNSVSVAPLKHTSKNAATDLIVKVSEREYGLLEFAPGYRTDIGLKLSGTFSYANLGGLNRSLALRGQVNQRLNYQTFDERRRKERREVIEFNTALNYTQGDIFDTNIDLGMGLSFQRRRFFSFDADIARYNATLTRDLAKRLSSTLRYQLENISQSDATEERDNGTFRIGAITPSLTWDLRNSQVNTTKGAFFNVSVEFANPYFLSQKTDELEINYYKLISRNRFYIPFKNGTVAISLVGGLQENLADGVVKDGSGNVILDEDGEPRTEGYIPSIKAFRLSGMDIVRGFNDEEINRLPTGFDVTTARITDKAYLANFKLEPRYFINDALMAGVFLDAGRVFVNQVDMDDLRTSTGVSFKVLTPVGTLDFDYGIKLDRKRAGEPGKEKLEDAGRFHVSIGFF